MLVQIFTQWVVLSKPHILRISSHSNVNKNLKNIKIRSVQGQLQPGKIFQDIGRLQLFTGNISGYSAKAVMWTRDFICFFLVIFSYICWFQLLRKGIVVDVSEFFIMCKKKSPLIVTPCLRCSGVQL